MSDVVVGRQPVFDRDLVVVGYDLLFRSVEGGGDADSGLGAGLTSSSVLHSSEGIGIELVGDKTLFCNAERGSLVDMRRVVLPPERTVVEIAERLACDPEVLAGCRRLYNDGFLLALDDYTGAPGAQAPLELAALVKLDLRLIPEWELGRLVEECRQAGLLVVAKRVETEERFDYCKELGFDYFQGYLLSRPRIVSRHALTVFNKGRLAHAASLLERGGSFDELERIVRTEPVLAYRVLQLAGLPSGERPHPGVKTLREALGRVSSRQLGDSMRLVLAMQGNEAAEEPVVTTLSRARMCELLAGARDPGLGDTAYAAGLLSCFDLLLDTPVEDVVLSLRLDPELRHGALQEHTHLGRLVHDVVDYQNGRADRAVRSKVETRALHAASSAALSWALEHAHGSHGALAV